MSVDHSLLLEYDTDSPKKFESIKEYLVGNIPFDTSIVHIGSSSVVGLGGKKIIDVMIITQEEKMMKVVGILKENGFKFIAKPGAGIFDDRYFVSGPYYYESKEIHIHIHVTYQNSKPCNDHLDFRDYLRNHPEEAHIYQENKKKWMQEAENDILIFTELKSPYISKIIKKQALTRPLNLEIAPAFAL